MPTRYESTTRGQIRDDADTFLDEWGESVVRRIGGDSQYTETILAIVDQDDEMGSGMDGDGLDPLTHPKGERLRRSILFEVKHDTTLDENDTIVFEDQIWSLHRIAARDAGMKTFAGSRVDGGTSKQARMRP